jgi:hypothetical protein
MTVLVPGRARTRKPSLARLSSLAFVTAALLAPILAARAQGLDPRAYANLPVGLNFTILGVGYTEGTMAFDPSTRITDTQYYSDLAAFAYVHTFAAWGNSAKFDMVLPAATLSGHALVAGQPRQREVSGLADPQFRVSLNFHGAPAMSLKEFAGYRQDLIVGASLQVTAPLGQYDSSKLVNLGNNRWSFKPELGVSKAWGAWTVDLAPSVTFYTDNNNFNGGNTFGQEPLYAIQGNLVHTFASNAWIAFGATFYAGNRTILNGVKGDNMQGNSRAGLTYALPLDRFNSLKLYASAGTSTRTGSDFTAVGAAWQYRWGDGQ